MSINTVVLLGAGFSRNWGAPLASEVATWLLQEAGDDSYLQELLTQPGRSFESALAQVQQEYVSSPSSPPARERLDRFQTAIAKMFEQLNAALELTSFEFSQDRRFSISDFLARFDAIFGLNQDLLLELHYEDQVISANSRRWDRLGRPGMRQVQPSSLTDRRRQRWVPAPPPFAVAPRCQPYFKLHGSSNWHTNDGQNLLVMGGNKDSAISKSDVLSWYYSQFRDYLSRRGTRLMVIGYSFSDQHINNAIIEAWRGGTLKGMFLVDPNGRAALDSPRGGLPEPTHKDLDDIVCLGGSIRPISETFAGRDFEHQRFIKFFKSI